MADRKRKKAKPLRMWAIIDTRGSMWAGALKSTKRAAKDYFGAGETPWKRASKRGYRIVRVLVTEE